MCSTTPADFDGTRFNGPHSCDNWVSASALFAFSHVFVHLLGRDRMVSGEFGGSMTQAVKCICTCIPSINKIRVKRRNIRHSRIML
jgi:hypothetical protein